MITKLRKEIQIGQCFRYLQPYQDPIAFHADNAYICVDPVFRYNRFGDKWAASPQCPMNVEPGNGDRRVVLLEDYKTHPVPTIKEDHKGLRAEEKKPCSSSSLEWPFLALMQKELAEEERLVTAYSNAMRNDSVRTHPSTKQKYVSNAGVFNLSPAEFERAAALFSTRVSAKVAKTDAEEKERARTVVVVDRDEDYWP